MLMHWKSKVGVGKVTSMARVMGSGSSYRICLSEIRSIVCGRVGITRMGHPTAPYPSLGSGPSHPAPYLSLGSGPSHLIDLGDLLAQDLP